MKTSLSLVNKFNSLLLHLKQLLPFHHPSLLFLPFHLSVTQRGWGTAQCHVSGTNTNMMHGEIPKHTVHVYIKLLRQRFRRTPQKSEISWPIWLNLLYLDFISPGEGGGIVQAWSCSLQEMPWQSREIIPISIFYSWPLSHTPEIVLWSPLLCPHREEPSVKWHPTSSQRTANKDGFTKGGGYCHCMLTQAFQ